MRQVDRPEQGPVRGRTTRILLTLTVLALITIPFLLRLPLLETRGFNPDELEHLHWSWCVSKDLVPDRDYFDHHTPWLHFFMSPFYSFYDTDWSGNDAINFIFMARRWMWFFAGAILILIFALGRAWRDAETGLLATLFLGNTAFFLSKSLEFRPAVPAAALLVGSVLLMLVAVRRSNRRESGAYWRLFASGLLLGAATMFTQKVLFVGPGFALATAWFVLDRRLSPDLWTRLRLVSTQFAGFILPVAGTLGYFAWQDALWPFINYNFFLNTRWPGLSAQGFLNELVRQDPLFVLLAVIGFLTQAKTVCQIQGAQRGEPVLALITISLWATLPLHPAMSYQHFLLILPLTALYVGVALVRSVNGLTVVLESLGRTWRRPLFAVAVVAAGSVVCWAVLQWLPARDLTLPLWMRIVSAGLILLLPLLFWLGPKNGVLTVAVLLLSAYPMERFRSSFERGNWGDIQAIRYVIRNSAPWETTLDGFTGLGYSRPQAFFHHFFYPHIFALQTDEEHEEMLEMLEDGRAMPKFIFWSHYLRDSVTQEMAAFLNEHYVPTGLEPVRVRPFDNGLGWWSDEEPRYLGWVPGQERAPHVLFDDGWRTPGTEFGLPVRRTRTRKSTLIVPIRYPRDFKITLRAHGDADATPFGVELVVNGATAGVREAVPRWQDYEFHVTVHQLQPGFNAFELRFSAEDASEERRLELAVNYLQLTPVETRER